jgi:uncharacterized protein YsxB (DUF464 family)
MKSKKIKLEIEEILDTSQDYLRILSSHIKSEKYELAKLLSTRMSANFRDLTDSIEEYVKVKKREDLEKIELENKKKKLTK